MVDVFSHVIQFKGTHYDFGVMQGKRLIDSPILINRNKQIFARRKRNFNINQAAYHDIITTFAPHIWEEISGLADGLKIDMDSAILQFGGYYLEYQSSGCSMFSGDDYLVRNYDYHPSSYDGRYLIFEPTDQGYATIGPSMQITGRTDGMNEKGLSIGYNFVNRRNSGDGFLCNMISRIILQTCANVNEAIELLKVIPHRNTFNYILFDRDAVTYVVEASPREVTVRQDNICTNHFENLTHENRHHMKDSKRRMQLITERQLHVKKSYDAFKMMNNLEEGIFATDYDASSGTLHTAIYYPKELKAGISLSANRPPFLFDFKAWLDGERYTITKLKGTLDNQRPFANMNQP